MNDSSVTHSLMKNKNSGLVANSGNNTTFGNQELSFTRSEAEVMGKFGKSPVVSTESKLPNYHQ